MRKRSILKALACCTAACLISNPAIAQQSGVLAGMSTKEVRRAFGEPDKEEQHSSGAKIWQYGQAQLFFSNNRLMAWSAAGALDQRQRLQRLKSRPGDSLSRFAEDGWHNTWTPKSEKRREHHNDANREEVLEDIILGD